MKKPIRYYQIVNFKPLSMRDAVEMYMEDLIELKIRPCSGDAITYIVESEYILRNAKKIIAQIDVSYLN